MLASYAYDDLGRRSSVTFGNGSAQSFAFDPASRLSALTNDLSGSTNDLNQSFAYNPAGQIASATRSGDVYAWAGHVNATEAYASNGLNQLTSAAGQSITHDARGNITGIGGASYVYSQRNQLHDVPGSATNLYYEPLGRIDQIYNYAAGVRTMLDYDGLDLVAEYNASGTLQRRYVHGPGIDEPIVWYEGAGTADRRFLMADERGSIVSVTNASGGVIATNTYEEYGRPGSGNIGRFQYTGQAYIPELGLYNYKARIYNPEIGRFMQTDPIGYADGLNWYNYVGGDPVNFVDPLGLRWISTQVCRRASVTVEGKTTSGFACYNAYQWIADPDKIFEIRHENVNDGDIFYCPVPENEPGAVLYDAASLDAVIGIGFSGMSGTFQNSKTGTYGKFFTVGLSGGGMAGFGSSEGRAESLNDFVGWADSTSSGTRGGSVDIVKNLFGKTVAVGTTFGIGTPGYVGTFGKTIIYEVYQDPARCNND